MIGLGSMGKRRIRCLQALGVENIIGFDVRQDRRTEAHFKEVHVVSKLQIGLERNPDVAFICTPPDEHWASAFVCERAGIPFFTEASVIPITDLDGHPSCTMRFWAGPRQVRTAITFGDIGRPLSFVYHVGQYLPDWHPYEDYRTFYVSKRATGACREIVPFELCWLTWCFGQVTTVMAYKGKLSDLDCDIDDVYQLLLEFDGGVRGMLQVDVLAHRAVRHFHLVGSEDDIVLDIKGDESFYVDETRAFLDAIQGESVWPYTYQHEARVLAVLTAAERSHEEGHRVHLDN